MDIVVAVMDIVVAVLCLTVFRWCFHADDYEVRQSKRILAAAFGR